MPNRSTNNIDEEHNNDDKVENNREKLNLKGDYGNIAILLFLYFLQGDKYYNV